MNTVWCLRHSQLVIKTFPCFRSGMESVERLFRLDAEEELRVEVDCGKTDKVTVELKSGLAEIFGTEMVINTK